MLLTRSGHSMEFRLFRMSIKGKVAVANLLLVDCALVVLMIQARLVPEYYPRPVAIADTAMAVLSFPVGWFTMFLVDTMVSMAVLPTGWFDVPAFSAQAEVWTYVFDAVSLPLNAYLWGYVVATFIRWRKQRRPSNAIDGTPIQP